MEPKTFKKLSDSQEIKSFIAYVSDEIKKLDTLDEIETDVPELVAIEVKARKLARTKLASILKPLLDMNEGSGKFNNKEYVV